ncbi:Cysteine desulfurase [Denitrovibrio acetiphilus DSM 12809]|uniref:Cysteine desulfurase n=1 Tax=Denitrovibrio acetiphilus (strain DSM 12809 / NBRC 114555 / N2460) TaxID=522772 RepID=D4H7L6_DENA2|nr:cysteine desulfurase family protein [Denitrovibrio acetiphilus]ADD68015.1 Cysteine desulfurase [Denitrovibrio acetiphilus DSM 12809]
MIYLDNVAGTKPDQRVIEKMMPFFTEHYGNPSAHFYPIGREAFEAMEAARVQVAEFIGAKADEIVFTSSGTESNNLAIKGFLGHTANKGKHIIISEIEHFSVDTVVTKLLNDGYKITKLKVDNGGLVNPADLEKAINEDTVLVSIQYVNPEIGTIQYTEKLGEICKSKGVAFHVDAVAAAGFVEIDVNKLNCDMLSIASQNFFGPKGAAALFIKEGTKLIGLMDGGFQERGYRSGTENVPAIVGMGEACALAKAEMGDYVPRLVAMQKKLWEGLSGQFDFLHFTGHESRRRPGHVSFWIEYIEGESLLMWLSLKGIACASGSACSSNILADDEDDLVASSVLTAVGVPTDICAGSLGMSMSRYNIEEDVDKVLEVMPETVQKLCEMSPMYNRDK